MSLKKKKSTSREQPDRRDAEGRVCGKEQRKSMPSPGASFSPHLHVFTNLEALQALFRDFYGDFIARVLLIKSLAIGD